MAQLSPERLIRLDDCLHPDNYTLVDLTPVAAIIPRTGTARPQGGRDRSSGPRLSSRVFCLADPAVVHALLDKCHDHLRAYLKKDIPDELHYKNNVRIQPILLMADEGWTIVQRGELPKCMMIIMKCS